MSYIGNQPSTVAFPSDTFSGTGSQTAFTMTVAPANTTSAMIYISGVKQDPSTYSVSGTTLTFSAAPPSGTNNISVIYLGIPASGVTTTAYRSINEATATAGQTSFSVPSYTVGYIDVYRNGVRLNSADYTATSGTTVVLASGATAGDTVTTESFYVSSVNGAIPQTNGAVTTPYILDGAVTQAKLASGVAGNGPAFSAYGTGSNQSISTGTWTKAQLNAEEFDTASCFDSTTNYRFTPTVAGYYQINGNIYFSGTSLTRGIVAIYKNGGIWKMGNYMPPFNSTQGVAVVASIVYFNGSTDYVELYGLVQGTSPVFERDQTQVYMTGALVRSA